MSRNTLTATAILVATVLAGAATPASGDDCAVADPTGTPLNVRSEPQGRVLSVLGNGVTVQVVDESTLSGKHWAKVAVDGKTLGWVFAAYLDCAVVGDSHKSAPMRPRIAPQ